jgi:hypothetical protein
MTNNDNDDDDNNDSDNNNYRDLTKDLKETLEAMERQGKERGLSDKEMLNEYILSYLAEQERKQQATLIFRFNSILRVYMPFIMSNEDVRLKVIKVYDEIVQSLERQLDEAMRMREEIREEGKIIEEGDEEETKKLRKRNQK